MGCCGYDTIGGAPASGGGTASAADDQAFSIFGLNAAIVGAVDQQIAYFSGATTQVGATALAVTRTDTANNGTTLQLPQGTYQVHAQALLPAGGTAGLMIGWTLDAPAALLTLGTNPDPWLPSVGGSDLWQTWAAGPVAALNAIGTCVVTSTMVSGGLGVLRVNLTNIAGGVPVTGFDLIAAFTSVRVRRIGDAV